MKKQLNVIGKNGQKIKSSFINTKPPNMTSNEAKLARVKKVNSRSFLVETS